MPLTHCTDTWWIIYNLNIIIRGNVPNTFRLGFHGNVLIDFPNYISGEYLYKWKSTSQFSSKYTQCPTLWLSGQVWPCRLGTSEASYCSTPTTVFSVSSSNEKEIKLSSTVITGKMTRDVLNIFSNLLSWSFDPHHKSLFISKADRKTIGI